VVQLPIRRGQEGTKLCSINLSLLISFDAVITEGATPGRPTKSLERNKAD
jgi:hypothetical protein